VGLATLAQFVVGAIWYTPLFGETWGQIHEFDKLSTVPAVVRAAFQLFVNSTSLGAKWLFRVLNILIQLIIKIFYN
jgi:hypothetical protein